MTQCALVIAICRIIRVITSVSNNIRVIRIIRVITSVSNNIRVIRVIRVIIDYKKLLLELLELLMVL